MSDEVQSVTPTSESVGEPVQPTEEIVEEAREEALDFLEGLLDAMEMDGDVIADITEEGAIAAAIEGSDSGLLIGRRGQTLDAIQELLRTVLQRQAQTRLRVTLDIEGYRDRRKEALIKETQELAERALRDGEAALEPMSAYERKIVHDTAATIDGVESFSEGDEPRRRVILRSVN